jgi:LacI family transcriptional regulator
METPNLKMLAQQLKLSISTVSKALRDSHEIGEHTKKKVAALAKKLNYQPNPHASSLRKQKSKTIAVVIPEIANNFFSLAINGIESIAQERDYHVLIYLTHEDYTKEVNIIKHLQGGRVGGLIMSLSLATKKFDHLHELTKHNIPIVFFDRICHEIETAKVTTDDFQGGLAATEHLIINNSKHVAFASISNTISIDNKRMQGYLEAINKHQIKTSNTSIIKCSNNDTNNYNKFKKILSGKKAPDAIFASVEKLAVTIYEVCNDLNIKIPEQLKVICFSNLTTAHLMKPSLSAIKQPAFEMGKEAASILFKHLDKNRTFIPNEHIVIKSSLAARGSTAIK